VSDSPLPPDQTARTRIEDDLGATLFVEAGAGAGKTTSLVERILALVESGTPIDSIAAITFTEKAAAELRHRVRARLSERAAECNDRLHEPFSAALARLDHAPIGTLHAFARRILDEFPIFAGLPPGFQVLDELESNLAFEERWEDLMESLLAVAEPTAGPVAGGATFVQLCNFRRFGLHKGFRRVAVAFHDNWDLVQERVDATTPDPWEPDVTAVLALAGDIAGTDVPDGDKQAECIDAVRSAAAQLTDRPTLLGTLEALDELADIARRATRRGNRANWRGHRSVDDLETLRARHARLAELADAVLNEAATYRKRVIGTVLARWVGDAARARAADGAVEFHDLLVLARLTADPDDPAQQGDWRDLRPVPGRLFIVGDPKQSIYRFRRADIAQYLRAAEQVGADTERLTANFRSSAAVVDWVNVVFDELIEFAPDVQPDYQPLEMCRPEPTGHGSVRLLGIDRHDDLDGRGSADELRTREADDVAATVAAALGEGWPVGDRDDAGRQTLRPCRPGDIAILLPARTSLPALEEALRRIGLPYRAENSSVVYLTTEIRHVMLALRAADDASDGLALVAALRTPLYGCSDVELHEWRRGGGRWSIWAEPPAALADHPVARGLAHLRRLAARSTTTPPADLVAALVDERRLLDAALDDTDARDVWRRVRYVIEQARAWSDAGGHGLRRYLAWVRLQAGESRAADTILPEHDHDAVRIMTVHAAKGLEFPITVVSGTTTRPHRTGGYSVVWPAHGWGINQQQDEVFDDYQPVDEQMSDAERRRLLYVACTRAVDHLVVSLHRLDRNVADRGKMTNAELLFDGGAAAAPHTPAPGGQLAAWSPPSVAAPELELPDPEEYAAVRRVAFERAGRRHSVGATELAAGEAAVDDLDGGDPGVRKEPVDLDLPPWQRGRYGTAVGRAVHAVLQFADLRTGADIDEHAAAQCAAEGILGMDDTVATLARSAIAAPVVREALDLPHHRELFVAAPFGDRVLEGYIDLFVETPEGGLIVDYKTDRWPDPAEREERIGTYRLQLAAYAVALEHVLGRAVAGGMLVRCRSDAPAEQIALADWADAVAEIRRRAGT
jgi:ATP-dependent helicase/nuclease subunit A